MFNKISSVLMIKSLIYPFLLSFIPYMLLLSLLYESNDNASSISILIALFIFLPICLNFIIHEYKGIIIGFILIIPIFFINTYLAYIIIFILILPTFIAFIINKLKPFHIGYNVAMISIYFSLLMSGYLIYIQQDNATLTIYTKIYDFLYYTVLSYQNKDGFTMVESMGFVNNLPIISMFLPALTTYTIIMIFNFNYKVSLIISNRSYNTKYLLNNYILPPYFNIILIIIGSLAILSHKILEKQFILYYTLYNVFLILWLCYFYLGFEFIWQKLEAQQNMILKIFFIGMLFVALVEWFLIICIIGFLIDMKIIKNNYFIKHKF